MCRRKPLSAKHLTRKKHSILKLWTETASKRKVAPRCSLFTRRVAGTTEQPATRTADELVPRTEDLWKPVARSRNEPLKLG